jgi:hypothetical protein
MFIFFGILPRIHKSHAAEPNGSADPRLGTPGLTAILITITTTTKATSTIT